MKTRILSILLIVAMLLGMFTFLSFAAQKNTGTRHQLCTSLSAQANSYYDKNGFSYEYYSSLEGGNESCLKSIDSDLFQQLNKLMTDTMKSSVSYSDLTDYWPDTDRELGTNEATLFYSDVTSGSYNREHVWPKSRASFLKKDGGCDIHHLRPTNSNINSTRSNYTMGNVQDRYTDCSVKKNNEGVIIWYNGSHKENGQTIGLVEVRDNVKGDVARIFLYVYTRWIEPNLFENDPSPYVGPNDDENNGLKVIESLDTLLEWCEEDPVDTWEMSRNDACEDIQGNRNVFIDYPEFAWLLFGRDIPAGMSTPSGIASGITPCMHPASREERTEPTCTAAGSIKTICTSCGKVLDTVVIPADGHNFADGVCTVCGAEESVAMGAFALSRSIKAGDEVIIVCKAKNIALSSDVNADSTYYNAGVAVTPVAGMINDAPEEIVWTVGEKNGAYTFSHNGRAISMGDEFSSTPFDEKNDTWALEEAKTAGASYIKNLGREVYLEWYEGKNYWSGYHNNSNEELFAMNFYVKGLEPVDPIDPTTPSEEPTTPSEEPTTPSEQPTTPSEQPTTPSEQPTTPSEQPTTPSEQPTNPSEQPTTPSEEPSEEPTEPEEEEEEELEEYKGFRDVDEDAWYYDYIVFAVEHGLMEGVAKKEFDPEGNVTRAMLVTILYRNEGEPDVDDLDNPFEDVKKREWYGEAVIWAADNEIVKGMTEDTFEPNTLITREQIATILYRYAEFCEVDVEEFEDTSLKEFDDRKTVSSYAKDAIKWAVGAEIINGIDDNLAPTEPATRAQIAAMLNRYIDQFA